MGNLPKVPTLTARADGREDGSQPQVPMRFLERKRSAILAGGVAFLLLFVFLACCAVMMGGQAKADLGGVLVVFLIGGLFGLAARWIYLRGVADAYEEEEYEED